MIRACITIFTVKDDWNEGEDASTFFIDEVETLTFGTAADAIEHFKDNYGQYVKDPVFDVLDDRICTNFTGVPTGYNWRALTDEEEFLWKKGKQEAYSVEFSMKLYRFEPIEAEELEKIFNECK